LFVLLGFSCSSIRAFFSVDAGTVKDAVDSPTERLNPMDAPVGTQELSKLSGPVGWCLSLLRRQSRVYFGTYVAASPAHSGMQFADCS